MLSTIFEFNGIKINDVSDFSKSAYVSLTQVSGFSGSDISLNTEKVVDTHNTIDFPGYMSGRVITLSGGIIGKTEDDVLAKIRQINLAFSVPAFYQGRTDGYNDLIFYRGNLKGNGLKPYCGCDNIDGGAPDTKYGGNTYVNGGEEEIFEKYVVRARLKKLPRFDKDMHNHRKRLFYIELYCEDSLIYKLRDYNDTLKGDYNFTLPNILPNYLIPRIESIIDYKGDLATYANFKIYGPFNGVEILNKTTNQTFSLAIKNGTIAEGEFIMIYGDEGKVYKNGIKNHANDLGVHIGLVSEWVFLNHGENNIEFRYSVLGYSKQPKCEISFREVFANIEI